MVYNSSVSFVISEDKLTVNSGIIFKKSKTIPYNKIQNITITGGPITNWFGLSRVNLWTSSPSQIVVHKGESNNRPDEFLDLKKEDAEWLMGNCTR